jgi:hypothetical protein
MKKFMKQFVIGFMIGYVVTDLAKKLFAEDLGLK